MRTQLVLLGVVLGAGLATTAFAQNTARGETVYTEQKCSVCHSIGDKGNKKGPLDGVGTRLSEADLRAWITDAKGMTAKTKAARKPEMRAYTLPQADVDALVTYLQTLKK